MVRLSRVLRKYENQFGSFPSTYINIKEEYDNWLGTNSNKYNSDELHHITMLKSLKEIGTNKKAPPGWFEHPTYRLTAWRSTY